MENVDAVRLAEPPADSPEFANWLRRTLTREDFEALPADDVEALRRFGTRIDYPAGVTLFRQCDSPDAILIVESGEVELVYETRYERLIVQILGPGSTIGDVPVLLETPYAYTAVTRTNTTVTRFGLEIVRTLVDVYPEICFRWLRLISRRLDRAHRRLVELAGKTAFEQLVHFLLHEAEDRRSLVLEISQRDLAATLGLSRQTVSRVLGVLDRQGVLERGRARIVIREPQLLRNHLPQ